MGRSLYVSNDDGKVCAVDGKVENKCTTDKKVQCKCSSAIGEKWLAASAQRLRDGLFEKAARNIHKPEW